MYYSVMFWLESTQKAHMKPTVHYKNIISHLICLFVDETWGENMADDKLRFILANVKMCFSSHLCQG